LVELCVSTTKLVLAGIAGARIVRHDASTSKSVPRASSLPSTETEWSTISSPSSRSVASAAAAGDRCTSSVHVTAVGCSPVPRMKHRSMAGTVKGGAE
jgi:hypothetical protein